MRREAGRGAADGLGEVDPRAGGESFGGDRGLAVDDGYVYWSETERGAIVRAMK